jgi:hypothetical protein
VRLHGGDELLHFRLAELEMGKAVALVSTVETVDQSSHFHTIHPGDKDVDATGTESEAADQRKKTRRNLLQHQNQASNTSEYRRLT